MLTKKQIAAMLQLQYQMNAKVNPDWVNAGYDWLRAVLVEGGEAMDHYGWKWWKKQTSDLPQFRIELVDIWHFLLSHTIVTNVGDMAGAVETINNNLSNEYQRDGLMFDSKFYKFAAMSVQERLELLMGLSVARRISFPLFETLLESAGWTWADLYTGYVSKNVLNFFRQNNGYKDGTYIKIWSGREDNEWLVDICAKLDPHAADYSGDLYHALSNAYQSYALDQSVIHAVAQ